MKIIQVMNIYDDGEVNTIGGRVYDPKGIMRTLGGGHAMSQPLIIVVEEVNGQSDGVGGGLERRDQTKGHNGISRTVSMTLKE